VKARSVGIGSREDRPLVATALHAGLRKGELFGLQKCDVDLKRRLLTVRRCSSRGLTARCGPRPTSSAGACVLLWAAPASSRAIGHSAVAVSARVRHTKRSILTASGAAARSAGWSSGPRRCRAASAFTTRGTRRRRCSSRPASTSTRSRGSSGTRTPRFTFETYAHLVPCYLHAQIDRLPKLDTFAALVLQAPPEPTDPPRGSFKNGLIPA
jgi:hypothetical protein